MRAVNLIPADQQRGAGGAAGRSGGGAYFLLGALALVVVMAAAYVLAGRSVSDKRAELTRVTQQAQQAEAHATSLASYTKFAVVSARRVQTVSQLAAGRFDWAHALREVARVLPENAWLTSLTGTTSPGVAVDGGGSALRGALPVPAVEVNGCTTSQSSVAKMMARMRLIDGVQRVSLEDSAKGEASAGSATGGDDCRGGSSRFPMFKMVVFFAATPGVTAGTAGGQQTAAATASSTTPSSTATTSTTTPSTTSSSPAPGGTP